MSTSTALPLPAAPARPPARTARPPRPRPAGPSVRAAWAWENRKASNRWYWAALAALCALGMAGSWYRYTSFRAEFDAQGTTWLAVWSQATLLPTMLFLPLLVAALTAQTAAGEHQGRNWQRMSANRLETAMVAGKLLHGLQVAVATTAILVLTTTLTGLMAGFGLPDLTSYLPRFGAVALGMWVILTLVTWLGAVLRSFTTTMTTVVLGTIAGTAMFLTAQPLSVLNPMTALTRATASLNPGAIASADSAASDSLISVAWVTLFALALLRTVKTAVR